MAHQRGMRRAHRRSSYVQRIRTRFSAPPVASSSMDGAADQSDESRELATDVQLVRLWGARRKLPPRQMVVQSRATSRRSSSRVCSSSACGGHAPVAHGLPPRLVLRQADELLLPLSVSPRFPCWYCVVFLCCCFVGYFCYSCCYMCVLLVVNVVSAVVYC
jgi:hypothetical protein